MIFPRHFVPDLCRRHCGRYVNMGAELLQRFALLIFFIYHGSRIANCFSFFFPSRAQHRRPLPFDFRGGQRRACTRVAARPGPISEFRGHVERMARSVSCDHGWRTSWRWQACWLLFLIWTNQTDFPKWLLRFILFSAQCSRAHIFHSSCCRAAGSCSCSTCIAWFMSVLLHV